MQLRTNSWAVLLPTVVAAMALWAAGGVASAAAPITVDVNGAPVYFTGTPPVETDGSVLVPLRGVFEAMGAGVDYSASTRTITAKKGDSYVVLPLGATVATVNGRAQTLSQPARVANGTTLVPLRFVAEALGAYVEWHAATSNVAITTSDQHLATLPPPSGTTEPVTGQLTGVFDNTSPRQITLRIDGRNTTVPIAGSTVILRSDANGASAVAPLASLHVGDQVTVQRNPDGFADSITATYGQLTGTVKSIGLLADGNHVITLNDGTTVQLVPGAAIRMNGRSIALSDVQTDEPVVIRTNPSNHYGYEVLVNPNNDAGIERAPEAIVPTISAFDVDANRPLRAGDIVTATLNGTPGGTAVMAIPGVTDRVAMTETSRGVYTAHFTVPSDLAVQGATVLGRLSVGGQQAPMIQAPERVTVSSVAPKITSISPARRSTVDTDVPLIYATLSDSGGIGIDTNQTRILLDGQDVTSAATITPAFVDLKPSAPLAPGTHSVRLSVVDLAGNTASAAWRFDVSSQKFVQSFNADVPAGSVLAAGDPVNLTLLAKPGGTATASIAGVASDIPLHETEPGVYTGTYRIKSGQNASNAPVTAHFLSATGRSVTTSLSSAISIAAGPPKAPTITSPIDGSPASQSLSIAGVASPNATVRIKVDYKSQALGGLVSMNGSAGTHEVVANQSGHWSLPDLPLQTDNMLSTSGNTQYTVTAVAVDANGNESPADTITVQGGHVYAHRTGQQ